MRKDFIASSQGNENPAKRTIPGKSAQTPKNEQIKAVRIFAALQKWMI
ncbi:hypothetical protein [Pararhizobium arenae]|nr:hypothetical protein [Pararhizobium arenae]